MKMQPAVRIGLLFGLIACTGSGCSTTSATRAEPLKATTGAAVDLSMYQVVTVVPFDATAAAVKDDTIGARFAHDVTRRLQHSFGQLFTEVREGPPTGKQDELIVTGTFTEYDPGDELARLMLIGMGAASFHGEVVLKDGADNHVLFRAPFDKLWAWGGLLGASKNAGRMQIEAAAAVANTVARAKGWIPPVQGVPDDRTFTFLHSRLQSPQPGHGRIWVFRGPEMEGALAAVSVSVDGMQVGSLVGNQFLYVDAVSGKHDVDVRGFTGTLNKKAASATATVATNSDVYIRIAAEMGWTWKLNVRQLPEVSALVPIGNANAARGFE